MRKCILLLILGLFSGVVLSAEIRVVTTTMQVGDLVSEIGGERVKVDRLMGPSVDPHLYKATARDVQLMTRADVIFYNGLHLEGRLTDVMVQLARKGKKVYAVSEGLNEKQLLSPDALEGAYDPHFWFDPELWTLAVDVVIEGLGAVDPENANEFAEAGKAYKAKLLGLKSWAKERIAKIPEENRILVTSHDAFNYFGNAFGFRVIGIQGISTVTEAGLADMAEMSDFIKENKVKAIFVESSVSHATIDRVSEDTGAKVGGEIFSDAMGKPGEMRAGISGESHDVGTYFGMLKYNVDTIVRALGEN